MKKYFVLLVLLSTFSFVKAGEPIRYGVVGGMNVSSLKMDGADNRLGFHLGGKAELALPSNFFLEGSLLFTQKGYESKNYINVDQNLVKWYLSSYYLELPVHLGYKLAVARDWSLLVSGGAYLGYGLFGKRKTTVAGTSNSTNLYKKYSGDKRFDAGLGLKAGVEFKQKIQLTASYDWGLLKANKHSKDAKNRNVMISVGYLF